MSENFIALQNLIHGRPRNFGQRMHPYIPQAALNGAPNASSPWQESAFEEQAVGLGIRIFAPPLLPVYQGIEALEDTPNISPELRQLVEVVEKVVYICVAFKILQWLSK